MNRNIIILSFFCLLNFCFSNEKLSIDFSYPSLSGDFYVNGKVSFQPGKVLTEDNVKVLDMETEEEIPTKITVLEKWYDGYILEVEILFPANTNKPKKYVLSYGPDVKRQKKFTQTSVLPIINAIIGKTPQSTETLNIDVGELLIKVDKSPEIRYYWYILPILLILYLTIYRTLKNSKQYEK